MRIAPLFLLLALSASAEEASLPRPQGLPKIVPADAVVKRHAGHGEGGLLEISWGHSSMLWAEPCRSKAAAENFAVDEKKTDGCPAAIDMQVRPMYYGTYDRKASRKAAKSRSKTPCCYSFDRIGNR